VRAKLTIAFKLAAIFPLAWFGGNIVFGIFADGSWLPGALYAVLRPRAFDVVITLALWLCRIGLFLLLLTLMFERSAPQLKQRSPD